MVLRIPRRRRLPALFAGFCAVLCAASSSARAELAAIGGVEDAADIGEDREWGGPCDGTDGELLAEVDEAFRTGIGYGETWDETICNDGLLIYGQGIRRFRTIEERRAAWEARQAAAEAFANEVGADGLTNRQRDEMAHKVDQRFLAMLIPVVGLGMFAIAGLVAGAIIVFLRARKTMVLDVTCPSCTMVMPYVVGEDSHLFCPACGTPCRVDIAYEGKTPKVAAIPL